MIRCQDYQFCHFIIVMKTHTTYSSEQIQKYLKFKKVSISSPNPSKEQLISGVVSNTLEELGSSIISPEIIQSHRQIESEGRKPTVTMDKMSLLKQRYLNKYKQEKTSISNILQNVKELQNSTQKANTDYSGPKIILHVKVDIQPFQLPKMQETLKIKQTYPPVELLKYRQGSSIVHGIIVKRFNQVLHQSSVATSTEATDEEDINDIAEMDCKVDEDNLKCRDMVLDEEYGESNANIDVNEVLVPKERSIHQQIRLWMNSPLTVISETIPTAFQQTNFIFNSSNKAYNPSIGLMIHSFVLNSKTELTQAQKKALYHLAFEYFYKNASELTPELLIVLIKLGRRYLNENLQFFTHNLEKYCVIILNNRALFTAQQRIVIVNFFLQQTTLDYKEMGMLMLVQPNQRLIKRISSKTYSMHETIFLLCCANISRRQFAQVAEVQLRLISTICKDLEVEKELIQKILEFVKQMTVGEGLYQLHKQVKLKLIQLLSDQQVQVKVVEPERTSSKLIGYWSKAVGKFKNITTQQTFK